MPAPAITQLEAAELPVVRINVKNAGETKEYQLVLDYNAIAKISEVLKKDLSRHENWFGLSGPELSVVAWGAMDRFHPDVDLHKVRGWFSPPMFSALYAMLLEAAYPGIFEAFEKVQKDEEQAKKLGESQPNLPVAAGS